MSFLEELNDAQRVAVENTNGPSLVIAGAGSGKTRVLTYRIAQLLKLGVPAHRILALTFTNKAAKEMKERIAKIVGYDTARNLWMGTFHSIFSRILRQEAEVLGFSKNFSIYDTVDTKSLIKSLIKELQLDDQHYKPSDVYSRISSAKNNLITPAVYLNNPNIIANDKAARKPMIGELFKYYWSRCRQADAMDFDDLLLYTNILFRDHPAQLEVYQHKFDYILVDEYQDTNYSQYLIIKKLAEIHNNVCVVGDDAQSIYSFRGAKIENILNFQNDYPQYKLYKLEQNYRSTQNIVNAANSLIAKNNKQIQKRVYSENEEGDKIKVIRAMTDTEEGFIIANDIVDSRQREHLQYEDFSILYRTNAQSRIFEEALRKKNVPYKIYGSISFYQRKEIKDLLSYFRLIINHSDNEAFKRIINYPARGIGKTTIDKLQNYATANEKNLWDVVINVSSLELGLRKNTIAKLQEFASLIGEFSKEALVNDAYDLASKVASATGILKELYNSSAPEDVAKYENVQEILNGIKEFISSNQTDETGLITIDLYMENVALLTDQDNEKSDDKDKVTLMTVHSAKGLEFKKVFVVGLEEKLFPSMMSSGTEKELEEERRLFYVALTRAESSATLSWAQSRYKYGVPETCTPSRFIKEINPEFLDNQTPSREDFFDREDMNFNGNGRKFGSFNKKSSNSYQVNKPIGNNKISDYQSLNKGNSDPDFKGDNPDKIQSGMLIEHQRFGKGKVLKIEGSDNQRKALVFFQSVGEKQLLLKFAKLKIVKIN